MERKDLKAEVTYFERKSGTYFFSPDGVGGFWYDTLAECEDQHGRTELISVSEILDY